MVFVEVVFAGKELLVEAAKHNFFIPTFAFGHLISILAPSLSASFLLIATFKSSERYFYLTIISKAFCESISFQLAVWLNCFAFLFLKAFLGSAAWKNVSGKPEVSYVCKDW